jgi:hypothetical protein
MDVVALCLGWLWAVGAVTTVFLLVQIARHDIGHYAGELQHGPQTASDDSRTWN